MCKNNKAPQKPVLIIQPATSYDDLPKLCEIREDEVTWFREKASLPKELTISVKVYEDEPLPEPEEVQAAIITGAIDMVTDGYDWIEKTAEWTRKAIKVNTPVLGVCFGHQLLAHALGGKVGNNPRGAKFGNVSLDILEKDPLFDVLPKKTEMQVFHFQSVLKLPDDAKILASSAHDPYQAVRYADCAWGVQFHPEFDSEIMSYSYDVYEGAISDEGICVKTLRKQTFSDQDGQNLLKRFVEYAYQVR